MFYFMKKISIHRSSDKKGAKNYTPVSNEIIQGKHLTLEESGLLCYLLSLPIDFTVIQKNILKDFKGRISKGGFGSAWKGLVEKGYIVEEIYYRNNLRRVGWSVYETPISRDSEIRESRNRDSREPMLLKSTQIESKKIKSNNIESSINNNTGASILGGKVKRKSDPSMFFKEARMEAIQYLTGATHLGKDILLYSSPDQQDELLDKLGNIQFDIISPQLEKLHFANNQLQQMKSSSTEGLAEPEPT
jgi:hypothetical protein